MANEPIYVQVEGAKELSALLRRIGDKELQKANRIAFKQGAQVVADDARPHAPVGATGRLRDSVRAGATQKAGFVRGGTKRVDYFAAIHFGRGQGNVNFKHGRLASKVQRGGPIQGRPFLWDSLHRKREQVAAIYHREVMRLFNQIRSRG